MKNYLLIVCTLLLLAGCDKGQKNQNYLLDKTSKELDSVLKVLDVFGPDLQGRPVTIEVVLINELPDNLPQDSIDNYIQLVKGNSGSIIGNPTDFEVIVFAGQKVKWKGKKLPGVSGQKPRIEAITMKNGIPNNKDLITNGKRVDGDNDMEFDVKQNMNSGDKEHYEIVISFGQGNNKKTYTIDPVLNYHP